MMQLDLFATLAPAAPVVMPDMVAERLIEKGYAHNQHLLDINRSINAVYGNLPSRLFGFPIEYVDRNRLKDRDSELWLRHPDFEGLSFVDEIEADTGVKPYWQPFDEFGRERNIGQFWHAIDLLTDEHFGAMLDTRNFTDKPSVINGLRFHMDYSGLSVANARIVLSEYGCDEPEDRSAAFLRSGAVKVTKTQQGKHVGMWTKDEQSVWAAIHGIEDGLFKRKGGFLTFSKEFLAEKELAA